jgi:hypothetical protein
MWRVGCAALRFISSTVNKCNSADRYLERVIRSPYKKKKRKRAKDNPMHDAKM